MLIETMRRFPSLSIMNITSFSRHSPGDLKQDQISQDSSSPSHRQGSWFPFSAHLDPSLGPSTAGLLVSPVGVAFPQPGLQLYLCSSLLWRPLKGPQGSKRFVSSCSCCQAGGQASHDILVTASSDSRRKEINGAIFKGQNQSRVSGESWCLSN